MKVAYSTQFGGFNFSPLAETQYRKKKGINLTWYGRKADSECRVYKKLKDEEELWDVYRSSFCPHSLIASIIDLGDEVEKVPRESTFESDWDNDYSERSDPDLIEVIERLGEKAGDGIGITSIPDGAKYEITDYDGMESVVPPRKSWT